MSSSRRSITLISHSCPSLPIDGRVGLVSPSVAICATLSPARLGNSQKEMYVIPDSMSRFTRGRLGPYDFQRRSSIDHPPLRHFAKLRCSQRTPYGWAATQAAAVPTLVLHTRSGDGRIQAFESAWTSSPVMLKHRPCSPPNASNHTHSVHSVSSALTIRYGAQQSGHRFCTTPHPFTHRILGVKGLFSGSEMGGHSAGAKPSYLSHTLPPLNCGNHTRHIA